MSLTHPFLIRLIVALVAYVLFLPAIIGFKTLTHADILQQFNRPPTELPDLSQSLGNPPLAIQHAMRHLSERVGGVAYMTETLQKIRFNWFADPGAPLIARRGELVYLAAFDVTAPVMSNIGFSCRVGDEGQLPTWLDLLIENTQVVTQHLAPVVDKVGYLIVPSKPVLYHDQLPKGTPTSIREKCANAATSGELEHWAATVGQVDIPASYPLSLLTNNRDDPMYYPMGNFHAEGESAHDAATQLLRKIYPEHRVWPDIESQVVERAADLEFILTFPRILQFRVPNYGPHETQISDILTKQLRSQNAALKDVSIYTTNTPIIGGNALIIGNSFAKHTAPDVAPYFDRTTLYDMSSSTDEELSYVFSTLAPEADVVLFIVQDTAAKYWLWQKERDVLEAMVKPL
ncbi:MAG: hypothetical protein ABJL67_09140 [Sulfitobacter sp.]